MSCWVKSVALMVALMGAGCGATGPTTVAPTTEKEAWAVSEVARFAGMLHKQIGAEITDHEYKVPAGQQGCPKDAPKGYCDAAAWYIPPVFFWREYVNRDSTTLANLTAIAAHEVCHSVSPAHDQLLYNCIRSLGADPQFAPSEGQ